MHVFELIRFIERFESSGVTFDEIKHNYYDNDPEEIKQLIQSGLDLQELHKSGQGRGTRYYGIKFQIVEIRPDGGVIKVDTNKFIDGAIDVSKCVTAKEKIKVILESNHPLSQPITLSYREHLLDKSTNKELRDFVNDGMMDVDTRLIYDNLKKKNIIYSQKSKPRYNSIWLGKIDGKITIKKMYGGSEHLPEVKEFENYSEFEKYIRTLLGK